MRTIKELYDFYLENCVDEEKKEIPLSFEEWKENHGEEEREEELKRNTEEKAPLMYKGYLIKEIANYLHVSNPATGRELNIKFKTWPDAKEFINNLKYL